MREKGFGDPQKEIRVSQKLAVDERILAGLSRFAREKISLALFVHEGHRGRHVCQHAYHNHQEARQRRRDAEENVDEHRHQFGKRTGGKEIDAHFLEVIKNRASLTEGLDDRAEIRVEQHHRRGLHGDVTPTPHCNPNVGVLEGRGIVHTICKFVTTQKGIEENDSHHMYAFGSTCAMLTAVSQISMNHEGDLCKKNKNPTSRHRHNASMCLERLDNLELLLGGRARKHNLVVVCNRVPVCICQVGNVGTREEKAGVRDFPLARLGHLPHTVNKLARKYADLACDRSSGCGKVPRHHEHAYAGTADRLHHGGSFGTRRVSNAGKAHDAQILDQRRHLEVVRGSVHRELAPCTLR
eukprot:Opistho-2@55642